MTFRDPFLKADETTRRQFLGRAARGLLGVSVLPALPGLLGAQVVSAPRSGGMARNVIQVFLSGGLSHLDSFDPKPGTEEAGPLQALRTRADGIRVSQHFPHLAKQMDKVCVLNSMTSTQGAHEQARYFMHTSYQLRGTIRHPSLGAWLHHEQGGDHPSLPGHVCIGSGRGMVQAGYLDGKHGPLPVLDPAAGLASAQRPQGVDAEQAARRLKRLSEMDGAFNERFGDPAPQAYADMYDQATRLMTSKDLAAFDLEQESAAMRAAYGTDAFGQGCLLARRLVEHQVRYVEVINGGWDMHNDIFDELEDKCPSVDRALAALLADLEARGLLEDTLVVVATEFGRSPSIEGARNGRNHHPAAYSCLLAGGGVKGGYAHGKTDEAGRAVVEKPVTVPDFNATIAWALGLDLDKVHTSPEGRPFRVADKGRPVLEVFA